MSPKVDSGLCELCGHTFKGVRGLIAHCSKKHPARRGDSLGYQVSAGNGHGAGGGPESRQDPSSTAQDRGVCRPTTSVPCGEHACTPNVNRGSMSVVTVAQNPMWSLWCMIRSRRLGRSHQSPESRQGSVSVAQDPAVCRPSLRVQREDPVCRPVSVSLRHLDMPLDREQRCRVLVNSQREENVSSGFSMNCGSRAPGGPPSFLPKRGNC